MKSGSIECVDEALKTLKDNQITKNKCKTDYEINREYCVKKGVLLPVYEVQSNPDNSITINLMFFQSFPVFSRKTILKNITLKNLLIITHNADPSSITIEYNSNDDLSSTQVVIKSTKQQKNFEISIKPRFFGLGDLLYFLFQGTL